MNHDSSRQAGAAAELLKILAVADPFASVQQGQWYERLCAARAGQQPLPVPQGAVVIWRCDLVRAVAELLQLRAYRDIVRAKGARENAGPQAVVTFASLTTVDCPACDGKSPCDECSGQGKVIVSRADLDALRVLDESEGGHHD